MIFTNPEDSAPAYRSRERLSCLQGKLRIYPSNFVAPEVLSHPGELLYKTLSLR